MPFRSSVSIVASPRARVGKTLLARLLIDFHAQEGRAVAAFDLNAGDGTLAQFVPAHTTVSTIADVQGQMALFDRLIAADETYKIVDLGHDSFESFFAIAHKIGFVEEARRRAIAPAILYVITPDATAVEAFGACAATSRRRCWRPCTTRSSGRAAPRQIPVRRPRRGWRGCRRWRRACANMSRRRRFHLRMSWRPPIPPEVADELQHWLRRAYREFRELDLRILLADLQSAIRLGL